MRNTGVEKVALRLVVVFGLILGACGGGGGGARDGGPGGSGGSMAGGGGVTAGSGGSTAGTSGSGAAGATPDGGAGTTPDASDAPVGDAAGDAPLVVDAPVDMGPDGPIASGSWADLHVCGALGWGGIKPVAAFFADGASLAMAGMGSKVFDVVTGAVKRTYGGLVGDATSVAVSTDGARLAASVSVTVALSSGPRVVVWRVSDGAILWTRPGPTGVLSVAFSPDGTLLAMGDANNKVILADASTGATVRTYTEHASAVGGVVFSADGSLLATTDAGATVKIWKAADLATQRTLQGPTPPVRYDAAFSSDGTQVFSSALRGKYKVSDGTAIGATASSGSALFAPDGSTFYLSPTLYRASDGVPLRTASPGLGALAYNADSSSLLLAAEAQNAPITPVLWRVLDGAPGVGFPGDPLQAVAPAVSADGKRAFVGQRMYDLVTSQLVYDTPFVTTENANAVFSPDGTLVAAASGNGTLSLMKVSDGKIEKSITAHASSIRAIAFSPTGDRIATASDDHYVKVWSTNGLTEIRALGGVEGHTTGVTSVAWSPDGTSLASGSDGATNNIFVWRVSDGQIRKTISAPGHPVFTPDGAALRVNGYAVIQTFDLVGSAPVGILDVPSGYQILGRPVGPAGDVVAAASRSFGAELWSLPGGHALTAPGDPRDTRWVFFAPDRVVLASSGDVRKIVSWCRGPAIPPVVGPADPGGPIATVCGATRSFTGDFDGDNLDDCVYWPANTTSIQFHEGLGSGLVRTGAILSEGLGMCLTPTNFTNAVVADPNGDGRDDLVIIGVGVYPYPYTASVALGREDGVFRCPGGTPTRLATYIQGVPIVGDFTGDGGSDVLLVGFTVPSYPNNKMLDLTVLDGERAALNVRAISTDPGFFIGATGSVTSVSVSDVNVDGKLDVVTKVVVRRLDGTGPGAMTVTWYGKGDGTFQSTPPP